MSPSSLMDSVSNRAFTAFGFFAPLSRSAVSNACSYLSCCFSASNACFASSFAFCKSAILADSSSWPVAFVLNSCNCWSRSVNCCSKDFFSLLTASNFSFGMKLPSLMSTNLAPSPNLANTWPYNSSPNCSFKLISYTPLCPFYVF
ncbi:unnamed protein product [Bacillus phage SPP1]|uniref:Bacteriophage SPP1 complete nucleotide sequence n=1 Tax=Bacillus phage SPP1 TaxID=10724 RepID=O48444_BPSPP|nr:hypothetical protein SPP1p019 [Bacillus phage SPP1]CAA66590.1 unnamed protein product [Bacillus phage SPP1]